jgi:sugar/nucleoside kinase (ribokinase family)
MCHSFIIGDLVIDHTIFVRETTAYHQPKQDESIYQVLRRTDTAGGAANCARILAELSDGDTYLWGITGKSQWGEFRSILSHSQEVDGSAKSIEFRGIADETDARMNTISRLIVCGDHDRPVGFGPRFDEGGHLHVAPDKRKSVLHYLDRAKQKLKDAHKKLDVIIINDLDYGCLTQEVVDDVSEFAQRNQIPLFVDPKYKGEKYRRIAGKAILPNLKEWCDLVGERDKEAHWRQNVAMSRDLDKMAHRCFLHFPRFDYYVITCDRDGVVFIGPSFAAKQSARHVICKIPPHVLPGVDPIEQLGSGDVLSAVFAMEFDRIARDEPTSHETAQALKALIRANIAVACYRKMAWHRMPSRNWVTKALEGAEKDDKYNVSSNNYVALPKVEAVAGIKYLPKRDTIILSEHETIVPGWFSDDDGFRKLLVELRDYCLDGTHHMVLGGPSGSGKTRGVRDALLAPAADARGIDFVKVPDNVDLSGQVDLVLDSLKRSTPQRATVRLFAIDEALKRGFNDKKFALSWFNAASARSIRLLLIDTGFFENHPWNDEGKQEDIELLRRSKSFILSAPNQRPDDIPLAIAALILRNIPDGQSIKVRGDFLLAFTNAMLEQPSTEQLGKSIDSIVQGAVKDLVVRRTLELTGDHLPDSIRSHYLRGDSAEVGGWSKNHSGDKVARWFTFERGEKRVSVARSRRTQSRHGIA